MLPDRSLRILLVTVLVMAAGGCASTPRAVDSATVSTSPPAHDTLNALLWMQRAVEYRAVSEIIYRTAAEHLDEALADPNWNALTPDERAVDSNRLPPAVIVDVDETVLDNSAYQARLILSGAEYSEESWDAWVREEQARAVPGAVAFAQAATERGVTVVYITNRRDAREKETIANLRQLGFPVKDPSVFLGVGTQVAGCKQHASEKDCRRRWVGERYRVIMQVGDTLGDFVRLEDNSLAERESLFERYRDWFGNRWWMLATPTYGSWEPAVFGNDWKKTLEERRRDKRRALDTGEADWAR